MKLIEFLISENKKGWQWPGTIAKATSTKGVRGVNFYFDYACPPILSNTLIAPVPFSCSELVTRESYEAALAASKQEWDGEGLPPVGCECEHHSPSGMVTVVKIIAHFQNRAAMVAVFIPVEREFKTVDQAISDCFRPIRSEADKKRDEAAKGLMDYLVKNTCTDNVFYIQDVIGFYDAIAAGKIPHIRID
ncbi:hypothetical protein IDM36_15545 [Enterobacter mori]|uniref:Uncharacterized protein n=1 Tax=Enterobacter mori TaxID=539813 RepID=A0A7T0DTN0_9ENTR|nr:hypothetical protein [Enterobacter mori]QPJ99325.1 hypothetical protein IDM36_15545 [Enterobacter mori]